VALAPVTIEFAAEIALFPNAMAFAPLAFALKPTAKLVAPLAMLLEPTATPYWPLALAPFTVAPLNVVKPSPPPIATPPFAAVDVPVL
jgi:hypothetical protein